MALQSPTLIANAAVGILNRFVVLGQTVRRDADSDFAGGTGSTINIRVIGKPTVRVQATPGAAIIVDVLNDTVIALSLSAQTYNALRITDLELSMLIQDFGQQVLAPQIEVVSAAMEDSLYTAMGAITGGVLSTTAANVWAAIVAARKTLNANFVPYDNRFLAVGGNIEEMLLTSTSIPLQAIVQGGDATPYREAQLGRLAGFTVVSAPGLAETEARAYHRDAFTLATRAPSNPDGAAFSKSVSAHGFALRWLRDYDAAILSDRSVVSAFAGSALIDATRVVRLSTLAT